MPSCAEHIPVFIRNLQQGELPLVQYVMLSILESKMFFAYKQNEGTNDIRRML